MEQQSEQNNQPETYSVGAALRAGREAAGLSLNEVADRLKLSLRQLEAIERDDFDALPGATFVRGFVRNYARFLEIDPAPLMAALDGHFPSAANEVANLAREEQEAPHETGVDERNPNRWMVWALVGVVLGAAALWIFGRSSESLPDVTPQVPQQTASDTAMAASAPPVPASAALAARPASAPALTASAAAAAREASAAAAKVAAARAAAAKAAAAKAAAAKGASAPTAVEGAGRISISVSEPAWVAVVDATGNKLVYSTVTPGAPRDVSGTPPFKVRVGNAGKVLMNYNGQTVDLGEHTRGTTATLELK